MGCIESYKEREEFDMPNEFLKKTVSMLSIFSSEDQFKDIDLDYPEEFCIPSKDAKENQYLDCESVLITASSFHRNENELAFLISLPHLQK
ncbi:unnamed protein product [Blepharisma stoltei]|uniref:Uncharacterized protein n=1 Tax=Blepharisma stoltei TaxID=1481888 RepID=A0AAU9KE62_9CILI|nr:unnamed protein product [Blepharisma stoltei]